MKILYIILAATFLTGAVFAQKQRSTLPPVPLREVSGIVKDSTDNAVIGATVSLTSAKDTLRASTNADGIFVFKNVKLATFIISVKNLGYVPTNRKYLNNDAVKRLVLDPIIMKSESRMLQAVQINGTPSITYKTDTVEYRASDYKVRENATVDELLKKMEGMEVGTDGSLTHQGQAVTRARVNGKDFSGGDVANAIQNLPADIVEKIQIVDDYGDQAARTGIKDGDPQKVLNITTKANRSIGNNARINAGVGSNDRYNGSINAFRLNANQTIAVSGNVASTVNGVAGGQGGGSQSSGNQGGGNNQGSGSRGSNNQNGGTQSNSSSGSGGTTNRGGPSFSYRDTWGKKIEVNTNYSYNYNNVNSLNSSTSEQYSTKGTLYSINESTSDNNSKTHNFKFEFEYNIDSANFLRVTPSLSYADAYTNRDSKTFQSGITHQDQIGLNGTRNTAPNLGGLVFYQHIFHKRGRNFSMQLSSDNSNQNNDTEQNTHIFYYNNTSVTPEKDSLVHRLITNNNINSNYRGSVTFSEPLSAKSQLQFNGQVNYRGYDNSKITNVIGSTGLTKPIDSLSNIYNYSFTETRVALNYRFNETKYNFSIGITAVPGLLSGTKVSLNATTHRTSFNMIPIVRFQYQWSRQKQFSINYSGAPNEPSFNQIQPVRDVSIPTRPVVGNPDLKASFRNTVSLKFNNYIANSRFNISANVNTSVINNQVSSNTVQYTDSIFDSKLNKKIGSLIYETRYVNLNGTYSINGNYNISKQLADRKYTIALNGTIGFNNNVAMSNSVQYNARTLRINERFGPKINPTEWFEINPNVSFDYTKSTYTLPSISDRLTKTLAFSVDGQIDFLKTFNFGYTASKNYVSGINATISNNPFVINAYLEKNFLKKKSGTLRIQGYDLLNQNHFVNRTVSDFGITDTKSNSLSRYVMVSFRLRLQKWSGTPQRNGRDMKRRGDGSFINN